jgi:hypothetical protein
MEMGATAVSCSRGPGFARRAASAGLCIAALAALAGCGSSETTGTSTGTSTGTTTTTTTDTSVCMVGPTPETFALGLTEASTDGSLKMTLVAASPAPPAKGENSWTLKVTDGSGAPVTGASFTVKPYMPEHVHGTSIVPQMTPASQPGVYDVGILEFFMPGIWQTTITRDQDAGAPEAVVFTFCIPG